MELSDWCQSMVRSLRSVELEGYLQLRSISVVPEGLKKSKEEAYMPRVVSIGPRFKGSREGLLLMEDIKIRCMTYLLHRCKQQEHGGGASERLTSCCEEIWHIDNEIRASYVADINLEQHELANIMLVDGCFLLELLISKGLSNELPCHLNYPSPALQVLRDEDVLSDLTLLENQIPILVLYVLFRKLFRDSFAYNTMGRTTRINNLILSIFGYSVVHDQSREASHILDVVHFFVNGKCERQIKTERHHNQREHHVVDIIHAQTTETQQHVVKLKLKRCALRLLTAGVSIKAKLPEDEDNTRDGLSCFGLVWNILCAMLFRLCNIFLVNGKHLDLDNIPEEVEVKGLDFFFRFEKGKLEIEQLHITKTTKAKWCNLIAWEHRQSTRTDRGRGKFTWAALIFNSLVCCADDVQLLKDKKIVVDHLKMKNDDLVDFFRTIVIGVDHGVVDSDSYIQMVDDINNYSKAFFIKRTWKTLWNSFTYRQEWLLRFMNHNYNFVATVLSVLTVVQTVYAILTYYFPK